MNEWKETVKTAAGQRSLRGCFQSQQDRKEIARLSLTLLAVAAVSAAALGFVHSVTSPIIEQRTREKAELAMNAVLEADYYRELMSFAPENGVTAISQAVDDGSVSGYVCQVESMGFGGEMTLLVGVDTEKRVTGVAVIEHSETQAVGAKVVESETVLADFIGLAAPVAMTGGEEGFDAVSGATRSSDGVLKAVNAALDAVAKLETEGGR